MKGRAGIGVLLLATALAGPAWSQRDEGTGGVSPGLPTGTGSLRGTAVHPDTPERAAGLEISLFALLPDGSGGVGHARTDARGRFRFENISTDPSVLYLVGLRYREVAFSQRARFAPGESELSVVLEIAEPVSETSGGSGGVRVVESSIQLAWLGGVILVNESRHLHNTSTSIPNVPRDRREEARAPFRAGLPEGARDLALPLGQEENFSRSGDELRYWGPLRPGDQELRYAYRVPVEGRILNLRFGFPQGAENVRVLFPAASGLQVDSRQLEAGGEIPLEGTSFDSLGGARLGPDSQLELTLRLPETRNDPDALQLGEASLRVELDDTALQVTQEQRIHVEPESTLAGTADAPLLHLDLSPGSALEPLPASAARMGLEASPGGGLDLLGPLMPGEYQVSWRYRIPARGGAARLELRFPKDVPALDMRIADTGVVIESDRLHPLRPRAMGTRVYLIRGTRHIEAGETVEVHFRALRNRSGSRRLALALILALAALATFFATAPLRAEAEGTTSGAGARQPTAAARELLHERMRDLDQDFETGKIGEVDYEKMRSELRQRETALLRAEPETAADPPRGEKPSGRGERPR